MTAFTQPVRFLRIINMKTHPIFIYPHTSSKSQKCGALRDPVGPPEIPAAGLIASHEPVSAPLYQNIWQKPLRAYTKRLSRNSWNMYGSRELYALWWRLLQKFFAYVYVREMQAYVIRVGIIINNDCSGKFYLYISMYDRR